MMRECYEMGLVVTQGAPRYEGSNNMGIWGGVNMKAEHARIKKQFYRAKNGTDAQRRKVASGN